MLQIDNGKSIIDQKNCGFDGKSIIDQKNGADVKSVIDQKNSALLDHHKYDGKFPAGLEILIVDGDPANLSQVEDMLKKCHYVVTKCDRANEALSLLQREPNKFEIVICDFHMPDGFDLLRFASLEMDLPVIIMSRDDEKDMIMRGINYGACDYWVKPVNLGNIKLMWQHVVRKKRQQQMYKPVGSIADLAPSKTSDNDHGGELSSREKVVKKRERENEDDNSDNGAHNAKRPRMVWSPELHEKFVAAVTQLGDDRAVPKKILECMQNMGCEAVTRENIASHLQKYRLYKQKSNPPIENENIARDFKNMQSKKSIFEQGSSSSMWNIQPYALSSNQVIQSNGWRSSYDVSSQPQLMERSFFHSHAIGFTAATDTSSYYGGTLGPFMDPRNLMQSTVAEFNPNEPFMHEIPPQNVSIDLSFYNDEPVPSYHTYYTSHHGLIEDEGDVVSAGLAEQFDQAHFFPQENQ